MTEQLHSRNPLATDLLALLRERRTISTFLPEPVPDDLVEQALDAGRFAPNHKRTEPWRFTTLGPVTREAMAPLWSDVALRNLPKDASPERREEVQAASEAKWRSKPAVVIVSQVITADADRTEEDYAAVACAMQNIQLAAWALGLGSQWSTTPATRDRALLERAGIPEPERVVGFLFLGYAAAVPPGRRSPLSDVLRRNP
jgi:nitroreductase